MSRLRCTLPVIGSWRPAEISAPGALLGAANAQLEELAGKITDRQLRQSFWQAAPAHRQLRELWQTRDVGAEQIRPIGADRSYLLTDAVRRELRRYASFISASARCS